MKNLKSILFSLLAMMAVAVFMTSCEQESIIAENIIDLSYDEDALARRPSGTPIK